MLSRYLGNNTSAALRIVKDIYPAGKDFKVIDEGQENLIIVVDQAYTVRFPRSEQVWRQGSAERNVLERLADSSLQIPRLLHVSEDPAFIQTTYLVGNHLSASTARTLPIITQQKIGASIASFAYKLHQALPVQAIQPLLVTPSWSYSRYLKEVLYDRTDPNPRIDALAKQYYQAWLTKPAAKNTIIVHDDLHTGNLLFDDHYNLVGVLDFGAVCLGSPEQELRQTYRLGNVVFESAATTYEQLSSQPYDRVQAKLWVITQELASYCRQDSDAVHKRAFDNLCFWFPDL